MTGLNDTSPTCSSSTPNDPPDADPEIPTSNDANPDTRTAKQPTFPRFLVVESADPQKKLRDLNDVIMDTTIRGVTSASVSIKWMGPALLVEVPHEAYARNLQRMTQIDQFHIKVSPHRSLNTRKEVAKFGRAATGMSNEEVRDALNSSPRNRDMPFVAEAYRVSANRNNGKQPTGTFFLTFQGTTLPKKIRLGFEQFDVYLYTPSPRRCFKCQKFGHNTRVCRAREEVCQTCATPGHSKDTCPNSDNPKCLNCKGSHTASDRDCPRFVAEKAALQIQVESHCSLVDARKKVEQTSATTNKEPDSASTPEQRNSYARTVAINQADLLNRNLNLSEENARLREIISTLRKDNTSMQQRLDGYEKRLSNLEKSRVVDAHPDTSTDGVQTNTPSPAAATAEENSPAAGQFHGPHATGTAHPHISAGCSSRPTSTDNDVEGTPFPGGQPASPAPVEGANSSPPQEETSVTQDETPQFSGEAPSRAGGAKNANPQKATEALRSEEVVSQHVAVTSEAPGPARPLRNSPRKTPFRGFQDTERKEKPHASMPSLGPDLALNHIPLQSPTPRMKILNRGGLGKNNSSAKSKPNSTISPATKQARDRPQRSAQANKSGH